MKVLAILGSPRKGGNSDILADEVLRGATEAGAETEKIYLQDLSISPCRACYGCRGKGKCVQKDDGDYVLEKLIEADTIILSSPVYFYSISAQMKIMIDRTLPRYTEIRGKEFIFILTAAASKEEIQRALEPLYGFTDCLPSSHVRSVILGEGVYLKGEVKTTKAMKEAYKAGLNIYL